MALIIEDDAIIHIRKGDSGRFSLTIKTDEGETYTLQDGDRLFMTVKEKAGDSQALFTLEYNYGDEEFQINPEATESIEPGKYSFDVQLVTSSGDVETVFPHVGDARYEKNKNWKNFCVEAEVTTNG